MEVITTILLCTVGFLVYLVNANNNEILKLKHSQRNAERETAQFLTEKDEEILSLKRQLTSEKNKSLNPPAISGFEKRVRRELEKEILADGWIYKNQDTRLISLQTTKIVSLWKTI